MLHDNHKHLENNFFRKIPFHTLIIPLLLFLLFFTYYLSIYKSIFIRYWDEHAWIARSYYFDLFLPGDFKNPLWNSYQSIDQPKLAEYLYGLMLYPSYLENKKQNTNYSYIDFLVNHNFSDLDWRKYKNYRNTYNKFINWGADPTDTTPALLRKKFGSEIDKTLEMIYKARSINIFLLSSSIVIVYLLTQTVSNIYTAIVTSILFGFNYLIVNFGLRAHSDGLFVFIFMLSIYCMIIVFEKIIRLQYKKLAAPLFVLSITLPLLTQTKLNGIMLFMFFAIMIVGLIFYALLHNKKNLALLSVATFLFVSIAFINLFILLHPFLYNDPVTNTFQMFKHRQLTAIHRSIEEPKSALNSWGNRVITIYDNFLLNPEEYCRYNGLVSKEFKSCYRNIMMYLKIFLFIFGITFFIWKNCIQRPQLKSIVLVIMFIFIQSMMGFYLYLNWDRYYIHLVYFFIFFQIYGVWVIIEYMKSNHPLIEKILKIKRKSLNSF